MFFDALQGAFWEGRWSHAPEAMTVLKANRAYNISDLPKVFGTKTALIYRSNNMIR